MVLGGTRFLGRTFVENALEQGHELTLFNRGQTNPDLFLNVEKLKGDRDGDLALLRGRKWDVALDTCGYVPRIVGKSARLLVDSVEQYIFISSISVYADFSKAGLNEESALGKLEDQTIEQVTNDTYGPLKVLCEHAVNEIYSGRATILRCGLIVGPYDPTDRFTYWPVRIQRGGEVLAPSPPQAQVQFIDASDLAYFILLLAKKRTEGIFNTTGPAEKISMEQFLNKCNDVVGDKASLTWVSEEFITGNDAGHIPVWTPKDWRGIFQADCTRALRAGLTFRPLVQTIKNTLDWHATRPAEYELKVGLKPDQERDLLKKWHAASKAP